MSIDLEQNSNKNFFIYSLITVIIGELLINFFKFNIYFQAGSLFKLFLHSHIYISVFFLLFSFRVKDLEKFNSNFLLSFLLILIFFSLFQLFRFSPPDTDLYVSNPILARFGNIWYGPMFLVPVFVLWGLNKNSIFWFEKISINMIKIGIILFVLSFVFSFRVPYVLFLSSFCLLAGFSYSDTKRKCWIIAGLLVSIFVFYIEGYRSGILRIILALLCVYISTINFKILKKILILFFFVSPVLIAYDIFFNDPNIFQTIAQYSYQSETTLFVDTRTFLFKETFFQLEKNNNLLLGLGALGNYYSEYFFNLMLYFPSVEADFYIRSKVEVGFLQMLLKGGFVYILIITIIYVFLIFKSKLTKNSYTNNLTYISFSNFFFMGIENIPAFNYLNCLIWITLGISLCYSIQLKNDQEIKTIFSNNIS